jgi:FtsZ-binding cell division protein ZapB
VLQQHIQELTEERLHLQRALASHARVQEQLERDNEELGQRLNTQGGALEATRKLVG